MASLLEGKPSYYGLIIGLFLAGGLIFAANYFFIDQVKKDITVADAQIADLDKKIEQGRSAQRKLQQFREEVRRLELELEKLRRILPSSRNTDEIIKKVKSLVDQGDFILHKMAFPHPSAPGNDPYVEWPITISLDGRYHNLAVLFNRLSNFSRIINVEQISINALPVQTERTITADFVAKTFMYVEPKEPEPNAPKKKPASSSSDAGAGS